MLTSTSGLFQTWGDSDIEPSWRLVLMTGICLVPLWMTASGCSSCGSDTTAGGSPFDDTAIGGTTGGGVTDVERDDGSELASMPSDGASGFDGAGEGTTDTCRKEGCPSTCSGTPCGPNRTLCCTGEEVCIYGSCQTPGDPCRYSSQCPEGSYCEPTLDRCLPNSDQTEACIYRPPIGEFTPSREGRISGVSTQGNTYNRSLATPTVADIDVDGRPEIAVILYRGSLSGALVAVFNGEDRSLVDYGAVENIKPNSAGLAVGQLDVSTPQLEIVAPQKGGGLVALKLDSNGDLSTWWSNDSGALGDVDTESAPSIADIDGNGTPEVVFGFSVVDAQGNIWNDLNKGPAGGQRSGTGLTSVVDLDRTTGMNGNRDLEIIAGNRAMTLDGSMLWDVSDSVSDGFSAVGDFGNDGTPEVVTVTRGEVYVLDGTTGQTEFGPIAIPGGGEGGPPTIADFDNDEFVEFSAAGKGRYTVYDFGCGGPGRPGNECDSDRSDGILWSKSVQDTSSSRTGSSVFDFEADGQAEVVYNDECFLRVFDGTTGDVLYERANTSRTGSEYPIIVDVDEDNNSEIVVVSNNDQIDRDGCESNYDKYPKGGTTGVFVYADDQDNWVATRSIWNQHAYHITNVRQDGSIPTQETLHYRGDLTNSFRLNVQRGGRFDAPDLVITELEGTCRGERLEIEVTVANQGRVGVGAGIPVALYAGRSGNLSWLTGLKTTRPLRPGTSQTLTTTWQDPPIGSGSSWTIRAVADSNRQQESSEQECREDNNDETTTGTGCRCLKLGASCERDGQCCSNICRDDSGEGECISG